jgi:hypothetical protein
MTDPQQPELRRSGRGATDQDSAKAKAESSENKEASGNSASGHGEKGREPVPPEQQSPYPS